MTIEKYFFVFVGLLTAHFSGCTSLSPFSSRLNSDDEEQKNVAIKAAGINHDDYIKPVKVYGGFEEVAAFSQQHPENDVWLYYWGESCGPCKKTGPVFERNSLYSWTEQGKKVMGGSFYLFKMQLLSETNEKDPANFALRSNRNALPDNPYRDPTIVHKLFKAPCVIIYRNGAEVSRFAGFGNVNGPDACSSEDQIKELTEQYQDFIQTEEGRKYIEENPQYAPPGYDFPKPAASKKRLKRQHSGHSDMDMDDQGSLDGEEDSTGDGAVRVETIPLGPTDIQE